MAEVTARLARPIGLDSFADLAVTVLDLRSVADQMTVVLADPVDDATLALVRERMSTTDDDEINQRQAIRTALVALMAQPPLGPAPTSTDRLVWLTQRAALQDALLLPLAELFGAAPE